MKDYRDTVPKRNRKGNRTGYTTGSNAAAAAKACTIALLTGQFPEQVTITLPIGETAVMTPVETELTDTYARCCMVKDAGDDPDVTHGSLICAKVRRDEVAGITLDGGLGVGRVTLPGIGLPVGDPAINPVPREQIRENVTHGTQEATEEAAYLESNGLHVEIFVPEGEAMAKKTLNAKLGIIGGISILGTTGKVFAYSTASWRASVIQAVEVAAYNSPQKVVLTTGGRSERYAMTLMPDLPRTAFVQLSVFTGAGFETCARMGVHRAVFVGMVGKMVKTAQGHLQTHVAGNQVDFGFLQDVCRQAGADAALIEQVGRANTGRHFLELCQEAGDMRPVQLATEIAQRNLEAFVQSKGRPDLPVDTILIDFNRPNILAQQMSRIVAPQDVAAQGSTLIERFAENPTEAYEDDEDGRHIKA
ncbi:MAG: cobalt-precorrin-5B (C(1))-methyltransferase [Chloroflexota bacterium]